MISEKNSENHQKLPFFRAKNFIFLLLQQKKSEQKLPTEIVSSPSIFIKMVQFLIYMIFDVPTTKLHRDFWLIHFFLILWGPKAVKTVFVA